MLRTLWHRCVDRSCIRKWQQSSRGCCPTQHLRHLRAKSWSTLWRTRSLLTVNICLAEPLCPQVWTQSSSDSDCPLGLKLLFGQLSFLPHLSNDSLRAEDSLVFCFFICVTMYLSLLLSSGAILDQQASISLTLYQKHPWSGGWRYRAVRDGSEALLTCSCWLKPNGESPSARKARVEMLARAFRPLFNYGFFLLTITKTDRNTFFFSNTCGNSLKRIWDLDHSYFSSFHHIVMGQRCKGKEQFLHKVSIAQTGLS